MLDKNYYGIDACKGGWVMVKISGDVTTFRFKSNVSEFFPSFRENIRVLLDMPIGLLSRETNRFSQRPCDQTARKLLGKKHSSIFSPPCIEALHEEGYQQASQVNYEILGKKLSKQSWNIAPRIREINAFLHLHPTWRPYVLEAHPELAFQHMNGNLPLRYSKKTKEGIDERLMILKDTFPPACDTYQSMVSDGSFKGKANPDDLMDALGLAVLNITRGEKLANIADQTITDSLGNTMAIWL